MTSRKQAIAELIERLERASGPSRELDWEIHCRNGIEGVGAYGNHPHYTSSIDAAMILVAETDYIVAIHQLPKSWTVKIGSRVDDRAMTDIEAATLPNAIAACALDRAIAAEDEK